MESIPFLIAPIFSGAVTIAAPPPSQVRYHRFVYAIAVSCTAIIIAAIFKIEANLQIIGTDVPLATIVGTQLIISLMILVFIHIYLKTTEIRAKCEKVLYAQQRLDEKININPNQCSSEIDELKLAQIGLVNVNKHITLLVFIVYIMLVISLFPSILSFFFNT